MKIKRFNEKVNLILDDLRDEQMCFNASGDKIFLEKDWIIVRNFKDFTDFIENNEMPNIIAFDHDLADFDGNREYTGKDAADWLVNFCMDNDVKLPNFVVHSSNTVGNENIKSLLNNFKKFQG